jgi:bacterioferritin-associated ferredoxin
MIVCSCNVIRCTDIRAIAADGSVVRVSEVYERMGCAAQCGRCAREVRALLLETKVACSGQCGPCAKADLPCAIAVAAVAIAEQISAEPPPFEASLKAPFGVMASAALEAVREAEVA